MIRTLEAHDRPALSGGAGGDESRERLHDATDKLHQLFRGWDKIIPSERCIRWKLEMD